MVQTPKKQRQSAARKRKMTLERMKSAFLVVTKPHNAARSCRVVADRAAPEEAQAPKAAKDEETKEMKAMAASTKATRETLTLVVPASCCWLLRCSFRLSWCWFTCIM
jgi:hypothetical protein